MSEPAHEPRVFAGIDEAGLGPILGPMTLGYSVWRAPFRAHEAWKKLGRAISSEPKRDKDRFIVADSKEVHARNPRGRKRLEATALGFMALQRPNQRPPATSQEFLLATPARLRPADSVLAKHPWYRELPDELPRFQDPLALELRVAKLARELQKKEVEVLDLGVRICPSAILNESYQETENKGQTTWLMAAEVIKHLWREHAATTTRGLELVVDRLGGRAHYGALLSKALPRGTVKVIAEGDTSSSYGVTETATPASDRAARRMLITFVEKGERKSIACALASCLAKYARELVMEGFNAYFESLQPGLKPTAGYRLDGWRWLTDAEAALERSGLPREIIVRDR